MRTAATSYAQRENNTERYMTTEEFENEAELVRPILVATAAHMLGSDSEAEDAAQETLAKLWGMRGELRSPMAALARAVVRNLCVDTIRRRHAVIVPLSDKQRNMAETVTDNDPFSHVMKVIDLLPGGTADSNQAAAHRRNEHRRHSTTYRNERGRRAQDAQQGSYGSEETLS